MSRISWRRALAAVALGASAVLLSACGSSTTESELKPSRLISFGDAFSDVGQSSGNRYTVNDGTTNHWLAQVAAEYGITITASNAGGTGYARNGARVVEKPDLLGSSDTLTVTEQAAAFLAAGNTYAESDLVIVNGGMADVLAQAKAFLAGTQTQDEFVKNADTAGKALGTVARNLVASGAKHVVVVGTMNLGITPWAQASGQASAIESASQAFNSAFLVSVVDLGETVLYVDAAYYFNLAADKDTISSFGLNNSVNVACTSADAGAGIGIGSNEINSSLCTTGTIASGVTYNSYMFADKLYTTPNLQRQFGTYAYGRINNRW
ncbi:SGNH/GDSL hydrolase family protein [Pseudorhodoferax soli]|uniref:Phospholipase/lecithinase/hemolysin n=1 Tax=Pseudorhodoferax soli TaxID=545864 RepID=A0A368XU77_9BURK|nr:SGNH/GDSL hydrolase family protein [Pseudorhodoferax soli]RCW71531.1 phospholipase/lecithinase/hemolysin [Pseudorhodoferax soli]